MRVTFSRGTWLACDEGNRVQLTMTTSVKKSYKKLFLIIYLTTSRSSMAQTKYVRLRGVLSFEEIVTVFFKKNIFLFVRTHDTPRTYSVL